jgi:hypothetical protein
MLPARQRGASTRTNFGKLVKDAAPRGVSQPEGLGRRCGAALGRHPRRPRPSPRSGG